MDQKTMLKILGPAVAFGVIMLLLGVLLAPPGESAPRKVESKVAPANTPAEDDSGMADSLPPLDAKEWKPGPGEMKVWDVKEGEGEPCKPGAFANMHYTGWLTDGTVFDSSRTRGEPLRMSLGDLIKGWQEGVPGMKPGGIRRLVIPADWGYGSRATGKIPANSTLVFEVKLLSSQ
jgi:FKBP-type peptidyl-prolyl cis-trans isomerase